MEWLLTGFMAGAGVSFLGSLPPGILNATIVQVTLRNGIRAAGWFALACVLVEVAYSYVAVLLATSLLRLGRFAYVIELFSTGLLLVAGIYYVRKKTFQTTSTVIKHPFYLGIGLSIINVVAIPFWLVYTSLLSGLGLVRVMDSQGVSLYLSGIGLGTLLALLLFAVLSQYIHRVALNTDWINRVVGLLMVATSIYQAIHFIA